MSELTEHDVECCIGERDFLHITFAPLDIDARDPGILTRSLQQLGS
jgi:hypothetical protein